MLFAVDPLPCYTAQSIRQNGKTYYLDSDGHSWPSVTTILRATRPRQQRLALARWRDRVGREAATQISRQASQRGTGIHRYLRQRLQGQWLNQATFCPEALQPYWQSFAPILAEISQVRLVEGYVTHPDLGYAGELDCIASYQGMPCLCEWKTSDRPKGSIEALGDTPLQLAAYCGAANQTYAERSLRLQYLLLVVGIADQPAEVFWLTPDDLRRYWQQWLDRLKAYHRLYPIA